VFEYVTEKADIANEVVIQHSVQVCFGFFMLAAAEEGCDFPS
jgi:hypothetical protein